jgi:hypothetical protein
LFHLEATTLQKKRKKIARHFLQGKWQNFFRKEFLLSLNFVCLSLSAFFSSTFSVCWSKVAQFGEFKKKNSSKGLILTIHHTNRKNSNSLHKTEREKFLDFKGFHDICRE